MLISERLTGRMLQYDGKKYSVIAVAFSAERFFIVALRDISTGKLVEAELANCTDLGIIEEVK